MGFDLSAYDYLDLGSGDGGSLAVGAQRFGGHRGLGVDMDERKIAGAADAGFEVAYGDATRLEVTGAVRFATMMDFLEHVPSLADVERVIASAASAATDFLFIYHPSFEGEAYLRMLGLRQYWWDWTGHKSHVCIADYCAMFERLGLRQYMVRYVEPIIDSTHSSILRLDEPKNQHAYDASVHRARPLVAFEQPVWRAQEIFVALRSFEPEEWETVTRPREAAARSTARS
jgi:hypothetical protein